MFWQRQSDIPVKMKRVKCVDYNAKGQLSVITYTMILKHNIIEIMICFLFFRMFRIR